MNNLISNQASSLSSSFTGPADSNAPTWLVYTAKMGYAARGLIYVAIGSLAFLQGIGSGGKTTDSKGAIESLLGAPGGTLLLALLALGLFGYSIWRFCQAILDADDHGTDAKGLVVRAGLLVSALTHAALGGYCVSKAFQLGFGSSGGSGSSSETLTRKALDLPGGQWIVAAIGLIVIGVGVSHGIKAWKEKYKDHFKVDSATMKKLNAVCKFGLTARGISFLIIGGFFMAAAYSANANKAGGMKDVLQTTAEQSYGPYLLIGLATGLFMFGCYSFIEMLFRTINAPKCLNS